jgi:chemotaxis receptor (MCP) glutamine deamidase CheD
MMHYPAQFAYQFLGKGNIPLVASEEEQKGERKIFLLRIATQSCEWELGDV